MIIDLPVFFANYSIIKSNDRIAASKVLDFSWLFSNIKDRGGK